MMTISGSGTFNVRNNGFISNIGTGNTLNITGAGTVIELNTGGTVQSARSGNAIYITTDNVEINAGTAGSIISLDGNANAAIQIGGGSDTLGTVINVNGGSVISIGSGFAINDGAGTALTNNNTRISVTGGVVTAGGNSAIHSTGIRSTAVISGGVISNAAGNNINPAIDMVGDMTGVVPSPAYNITVNGTAVVQSSSVNGYALQTKGNVLVQGNSLITANNGRAINLVGMDSTALIQGGVVETTGNGTALSTATTNVETVVRASIEMTGGIVRSANGIAINATGADSKVTVSGGTVSTMSSSNHAINATGSGVAISINGTAEVSATAGDAIRTTATLADAVSVSGRAKVSSLTGRAIQANSAGAGVTISGTSQVFVLNDGNAVRCTGGNVTLTGGFVFAYGANALNVINSPAIGTPGSLGLVVTWNRAAGNRIYMQGDSISANPDLDIRISGSNSHFWWYNHPTMGGGINYAYGANVGFFPIDEVTICAEYGLIFVSANGRVYRNVDNNIVLDAGGLPMAPNNIEFFSYKEGAVFPPNLPRWGGSPGELRLYGFSWATNTSTIAIGTPLDALTIIGDTNIVVTGESTFEAANPSAVGVRFWSGNENVRVTGTETFKAAGSSWAPGTGIDINDGTLTFAGGTFIAQASRAVDWLDPSTNRIIADPSIFDYSWTFGRNYDGSGGITGYGAETPFELYTTDSFVRFKTVTPVNLISATQLGGISHIADSVAIELTFGSPVSGLTVDDITITNNGTVNAEKGALTGSGTTWVLTLNSVGAEGTVGILVSAHIDDYFIAGNVISGIEVYKADPNQFDLFLGHTVDIGGDYAMLFEFEILIADDPRAPRAIKLTTNPDDEEAYLVTYRNDTPLPADRIIGDNNNVLKLKHNEVVKIHFFSEGYFIVQEHINVGFITAYKMEGEDWYTAPDGLSKRFRLDTDTIIYCFNSLVPETPGAPARPVAPADPADPVNPRYPYGPDNPGFPTNPINPNTPGVTPTPIPPPPQLPPVLNTRSPQTGTDHNFTMPVILLILAIGTFAGAGIYRRKSK